jgi:hypothetical protein
MRARMMVALVAAAMAVAVFDWRGRGPRPRHAARPPGSTEWLADVAAHSAAAATVAYQLEMTVASADERTVVVREEGASDVESRRQWRTVALRSGGQPVAPLRLVVGDDRLWLSPGFVGEEMGLEPSGWIDASLTAIAPLRWDDPLPRSARKTRDLLHKAIGDAVVVGRENLRREPTTHVRSWVGDNPLDVWVDDDQRLRQIELVESRARTRVELKLELFDYDQPVTIQPPAPDEVLTDEEIVAAIVAKLPGRGP